MKKRFKHRAVWAFIIFMLHSAVGYSQDSAGDSQKPATRLDSIRTSSQENYLEIYFVADGVISDYKTFTLDDPARIVFDLLRIASRSEGLQKVAVDDQRVRGIRFHGYPGKVRVVLDTDQKYLDQYRVMPVPGGLKIRLGYESAPQPLQTATAPTTSEPAAMEKAIGSGEQQAPEVSQVPLQAPASAKTPAITGTAAMEQESDSMKKPVVTEVAPEIQTSSTITKIAGAAPAEADSAAGQQPAPAMPTRTTPPTSATADTLAQQEDTQALIELLMRKGLISEQEAGELKKKALRQRPPTLGEEAVIYIVPDLPEGEKQKIVEEITDKSKEDIQRLEQKTATQSEDIMQRQRLTDRNVEELERRLSDINEKQFKSEWAQRIRFGGDIRLRYEGIRYDDDNALLLDPSDPDSLLNTTNDRDRFRYRARLATKATIIDPRSRTTNVGKVDVGLRLASGNDDTPVSTNNTFGDYWLNDNVVFDQAYLKYAYKPSEPLWGNNIPEVMVTGGRIPNPWFNTDLVWDSDLNFEGAALNFYTDTQDMTKLKGFLTAGAFPLQEDAFSSDCDKYLYAGQIGMEYQPRTDFKAKLAFAYYDYVDIEGEASPPDQPTKSECTAPLFLQKGNTLFDIDPGPDILPALAADYNLINVTGQFDLGMFHPIHILLTGDYVENIGFDQDEVESRTNTEVDEETIGYQLGIQVGHSAIREFLDWDVFLYYKYLEADAVVDAFTDSDFHDGGTNAKGWILGGDLGLYHNVWLRLRWLTTNEIEGPQYEVDTLQVDVNARF